MSTHGEIKREIFKSVLRRYFFDNPETIMAFSGIDSNTLKRDERIKAIIENSPDNPRIVDDLWERTQEHVFNNFFRRMLSSGILNEKGEPYKLPTDNYGNPMLSDELIDDFMDGKKIAFMGAGPDSMTTISADKDELNMLLVNVNTVGKGRKELVPRIYEKTTNPDGSDAHIIDVGKWNMEDSLRSTYGDVPPSDTPPKSNFLQNWANNIKKWFTGRPTARWAPYEKYQKMQELQTAINIATNFKNASNELDPKNLDAAQKAAGDTTWQKALSDILVKQKKKAAEDLNKKQEAETKKIEDLNNNVPDEVQTENKVIEDLHLQEMPEETEEQKRLSEELEKERKQKLNESNERIKSIESYRKAFFGDNVQNTLCIAKEKHFKSVFAPGSYRENAIPEATDIINKNLVKLSEYAETGHVPLEDIDKLPEMLATVYLLGKLKSTYPDRYDSSLENIKNCEYDELPEYNQIIERFDLIKKNLTNVFKETNLPSSINKDPRNVINTWILNPKVPFNKRFDSVLVDQRAYETVSNKIKGIKPMPKIQGEKQKDQSIDNPKLENDILSMK